jgi:hypothetical protein
MARGRPEIPKSQQKKVAKQLLERQKRAGVYEKGLEGLGKGFLAGSAYPADVAEMIAKPGLTPSASYKAATMRPRGGGIEKVPPPVQDPKLKGTYPYFAKKMGIEPDSAESIAGSFFSLDPMAKAHAVAMGTKLVAGKLAGLGMGAAMLGGLKKVDDVGSATKPIFTSPGGAAAADIAKETIPANKVKSQLEGRGVNKEEMEWTGFNEWIKTKKGEVSKVELEEFFQQNQVEVREVVRGGKGSLTETQMQEIATNEVFHDITTGHRDQIIENILKKQEKSMPGGVDDSAVKAAYESKYSRPWGELPLTSKEGFARTYRIDNDLPGQAENAFDDAAWEYDNLIRAWSDSSITEAEMNQLNQMMKEADAPDIEALYGNTLAEIESGEYSLEHLNIDGAELQTKFSSSSWQLPGGENYRELLLIVPPKKVPWTKENVTPLSIDEIPSNVLANNPNSRTDFWYFDTPDGLQSVHKKSLDFKATDFLDDGTKTSGGTLNIRTQEEALEEVLTRTPDPKPRYTGGHFEENDVVAHIRFNERVDPDGNKVLFIEEIQSDWAHKGQSEGFKSESVEEVQKLAHDTREKFYSGKGNKTDEEWKELSHKVKEFDEREKIAKAGVQPGPFVTDTHQWTNLALKRMIRWGSDNGFDSIGWVTGKQSADRYKVSKQISKIKYSSTGVLGAYDKQGKLVLNETNVTQEKLAEYIGKEPANKLLEQETILSSRPGDSSGQGIVTFEDPSEANRFSLALQEHLGDGHLSDAAVADLDFAHGTINDTQIADRGNVVDFLNLPEQDLEMFSNYAAQYGGKVKTGVNRDGSILPNTTYQTLEGLDLDIGGEYHKLIYDEVLTAQAKKIGKKHGAKVEEGAVIASDPAQMRKAYQDNYANDYEIADINDYPEEFADEIASRIPGARSTVIVTPNGEYLSNPLSGDITFFDNVAHAQDQLNFNASQAAEDLPERFLLEMTEDLDEAAEKVWTMRLTDKLKNAAKDGMPYYVALPPLVIGAAAAQRTDAQRQQSKSDAQAIMAN